MVAASSPEVEDGVGDGVGGAAGWWSLNLMEVGGGVVLSMKDGKSSVDVQGSWTNGSAMGSAGGGVDEALVALSSPSVVL